AYRPAGWARITGSAGFDRTSVRQEVSVGNVWSSERKGAVQALPFIHAGFEGSVFSWLDMSFGVRKRWQVVSIEREVSDNRIPDNDNYQGAANNTTAPVGNEDNTNANRRVQTRANSSMVDDTRLMLGARIHVSGLQLV